nr:unnamed protein product [Callosobruchus analis]
MVVFGVNGRISDGGLLYKTEKWDFTFAPPAISRYQYTAAICIHRKRSLCSTPRFFKTLQLKGLTHDRTIFNYRLSRARCRIENTFGILAARFRVFHTTIGINLAAINHEVMACCVLHNFLRQKCTGTYTSMDSVDRENTTDGTMELGLRADHLANLQRRHVRNYSTEANEVRQAFMRYFNGNGAVPWQERMIN